MKPKLTSTVRNKLNLAEAHTSSTRIYASLTVSCHSSYNYSPNSACSQLPTLRHDVFQMQNEVIIKPYDTSTALHENTTCASLKVTRKWQSAQ